MKKNIIREKSFNFALEIICLYRELEDRRVYVVSKQLLKSGTSIGANIEEASAAQSRKDFIAKMCISSKEARETLYWLKLLKHSEITSINIDSYIRKCDEIVRILTSIVKSTQEKE